MQRTSAVDAAGGANPDDDNDDAGAFARSPPPPCAPPLPRRRAWAVAADARARLAVYRDDWLVESYIPFTHGGRARLFTRLILPASVYAAVNSALPAVAFGAQLAALTDGVLTPAHTLLATAAAGVVQAFLGGQPLLVVGVSEPVVLIWAFMAAFCRGRGLPYLAFAAWASVFAALALAAAALSGLCRRSAALLSRLCCEVFGTVISALFVAGAIKGLVGEFTFVAPGDSAAAQQPPAQSPTPDEPLLRLLALSNGLWAVIVATGVATTALALVDRARRWHAGWPWLRAPLADYGAPIAVALWTAASFAVPRIDAGGFSVPRRVPRFSLAALADGAAAAAPAMAACPGYAVAAAIVPGLVVAALFYFDHTVSSRMANNAGGGHPLVKPTAFDLDLLVCAVMTLALGLCGLPPTNGVIPQTPIMPCALLLRTGTDDVRRAAGDGGGGSGGGAGAHAPSARARNGNGVSVGVGDGPPLPPPPLPSPPKAAHHAAAGVVVESRWPNLIQGLLCGACLPLVPSALPLVPLSIVHGFFVFLALEPLGKMQLWRGQLWCLLTAAKTRARAHAHPVTAFLDGAGGPPPPLAAVALVSGVQLASALGITLLALLAGVAGVLFPLPLLLLLPLRWRLLPRVFDSGRWRRRLGGRAALDALDPPDADAPLVLDETDSSEDEDDDDADNGVDADAALAASAAAEAEEEEDDDRGRGAHGGSAEEGLVVGDEAQRRGGLRREPQLLGGPGGDDDGRLAGSREGAGEGGRGGAGAASNV